jgi:hypothetical protein
MQGIDAAGTIVADDIVLALAWDMGERDWMQTRCQIWIEVPKMQPGWQFICGDQWCKIATRPKDAEARAWLSPGESQRTRCLQHDVGWDTIIKKMKEGSGVRSKDC